MIMIKMEALAVVKTAREFATWGVQSSEWPDPESIDYLEIPMGVPAMETTRIRGVTSLL